LFADTEGGKEADVVCEHGVEENIGPRRDEVTGGMEEIA
jgi:hypothetical protein